MRKFAALILTLLITVSTAFATTIDKAISDSNINRSAVSVSVKDVETGKTVYKLNAQKPVSPASTLKIITMTTALNELGQDYEFSTALYKTTNNELILKLGADPFLTSKDLKKLFNSARIKNIIEPKTIFIDDLIIDNTEWGEGWQWDDDLNPLMPKFSAYNIDQNLLTILVNPTTLYAPAEIKMNVFYPTTFMNLVTTDEYTNVQISRNNNISPDILNVEGTVSKQYQQQIPVNYPKRYFMLRLEEALRAEKIDYYGAFSQKKLPLQNVYLVEKITNPISDAVEAIMKKSNNFVAESLFKIAGGHYAKVTGSAENSVEMLKAYCDKLNINTEDIKIVDGSGVSKNNLVTAEFMTDFLFAQYKTSENYPNMFASAGEGTLKNRMLYFGDKLKAKTGTLSDVSAIAGYITTIHNRTYAFDIMINDAKSSSSDKKMLEEYILRAIQTSY